MSKSKSIVQYSEHESRDYGLTFGRAELGTDFDSWEILRSEIQHKAYDFVRLKIRNPNTIQTRQIQSLSGQQHLLEILRVYTVRYPQRTSLIFDFGEYSFERTEKTNTDLLLQLIDETFEDIPFGNYTTATVLNNFPIEKQRKNLINYYRTELQKEQPNIEAFFIHTPESKNTGCILTTLFENATYTNYVGIRKSQRHKHALTKTINFLQFFYLQEKFQEGVSGAARLSNLHSQKAFESNHMTFIGYDFVYLLEI